MSNKKIYKLIFYMMIFSLAIIGSSYLLFASKNNAKDEENSSTIYIKYNKLFNINNIMPGWINDGKTYIDVGNNFASKLNDKEEFNSEEFANLHPNYYGVMEPIKIEIENKDNQKSNYKINIDNIKTNIIDEIKEAYDYNNNDLGYTKNNSDNLIITIYKNKIETNNIIYSSKILKNNETYSTEKLYSNKGKTNYYILVEYKQAEYNQNDEININLSGKINIISLEKTKIIYLK